MGDYYLNYCIHHIYINRRELIINNIGLLSDHDPRRANFASYFNIVNVILVQFLEEYHQREEAKLNRNKMYDKSMVN